MVPLTISSICDSTTSLPQKLYDSISISLADQRRLAPLTADQLRASLETLPQELYDIIASLVLKGDFWSERFPAQFQIDHSSRQNYKEQEWPRDYERWAEGCKYQWPSEDDEIESSRIEVEVRMPAETFPCS